MVDRVVLGRGRNTSGSDYGLWVSNPGFDVKTCAPEDLAFDSDAAGFGHVLAKGSVSIEDGSPADVDVTCPENARLAVLWYPVVSGWLGPRALTPTGANNLWAITVSQTFPTSTTCRTRFSTNHVSTISVAYAIAMLSM